MNRIGLRFLFVPLALSMPAVTQGLAASASPLIATYEVPVEDASLAPFARYPIALTLSSDASGARVLLFSLPRTLVGKRTSFRLVESGQGAGGRYLWEGEGAQASCAQEASGLRCDVRFPGLSVDPVGVRRALSLAPGLSTAERRARESISMRFGGEPIGIVTYPIFADSGHAD